MADYNMPTTGEIESASNLPWYCCFIFLAIFVSFFSLFNLFEGENVSEWTIALVIIWSVCLFLTIYFVIRDIKKKGTSRSRSFSDQLTELNRQYPNTLDNIQLFFKLTEIMAAKDEPYQKDLIAEYLEMIDNAIKKNAKFATLRETPEFQELIRIYEDM